MLAQFFKIENPFVEKIEPPGFLLTPFHTVPSIRLRQRQTLEAVQNRFVPRRGEERTPPRCPCSLRCRWGSLPLTLTLRAIGNDLWERRPRRDPWPLHPSRYWIDRGEGAAPTARELQVSK